MRPSLPLLSKIIPRSSLPASAKVLSHALPSLNRSKQPTILDQLVARRNAALTAGKTYPPNLRLEEFRNTKAAWMGVSRDVRRELKRAIQEK